jgi:hypothetical protein
VGLLPNSKLILWGNPTKHPGRKAATTISTNQSHIRLRILRQELGCSIEEALPIAELIGYVLDLPVEGAVATKESA